jgi:beta-lactam-binding protein with PASTA domain
MKKVITLSLLTATVFLIGCKLERSRLVPDVTNTTVDVARAIAERHGFLLVVTDEVESDDIAKGLICKQSPLPGSALRSGSMLTVLLSKGTSKVEVPDLKGFTVSDARVELFGLQLKVGTVDSDYSDEVEAGRVLASDPEAGTKVEKKTVVNLVLSRGEEPKVESQAEPESKLEGKPGVVPEVKPEAEATPESEISVPMLVGTSLTKAKTMIEDAGLATGTISYQVTGEFYAGTVMVQKPAAGEKVEKGSPVNLVVATERSGPCPFGPK